jgi:hypothetical protein
MTMMMVVVTMTTISYNDRTLYYNWALYNHRTLNYYWSFYDYWSVMMMVVPWHVIALNNNRVMMSMVMVTSFNTMMIVMMMLCRNCTCANECHCYEGENILFHNCTF